MVASQVSVITDAEFTQEVSSEYKIVLVYFWTPWCEPCGFVSPLVDWISEVYGDRLKVLKIEVGSNPESRNRCNVKWVPALRIFKGNQIVFSHEGAIAQAKLQEAIEKNLGGDLEELDKILGAIAKMQKKLLQMRQAIANGIAKQKPIQQKYHKNNSEANAWKQRALRALSQGDENLAREALKRKQPYQDTATQIKGLLEGQNQKIEDLKRNVTVLERKIVKAKRKEGLLRNRLKKSIGHQQTPKRSLKTRNQKNNPTSIEDKIRAIEAELQAEEKRINRNRNRQCSQPEDRTQRQETLGNVTQKTEDVIADFERLEKQILSTF